MRATLALSVALAAHMRSAAAAATGKAEGFAAGVTGGGTAPDVTPQTIEELVAYLGDDQPRNIVLTKEFNFIGSEGSANNSGCAPWGTEPACQTAISLANDWCSREQPDAPKIASITYDKAGTTPIEIKSNKSLIGRGAGAGIRGKGIRMSNGVENIIIQNIAITDLNPDYVWGGDAITMRGADMVWIDHVTVSKIGRQHVVAGNAGGGRVTISNSVFDGRSEKSATCNGHHYWAMLLIGENNDQFTLKGNHFHTLSGRGPKVGANTIMHAVNNVWSDIEGHAFEPEAGATILAEGNVFDNVSRPIKAIAGQKLFAVNDATAAAQCRQSLGRACQANSLTGAGAFVGSEASVLGSIKNPAPAVSATQTRTRIPRNAGAGKL